MVKFLKKIIKIILSKIPLKYINYVSNKSTVNFYSNKFSKIKKIEMTYKNTTDPNHKMWDYIISQVGHDQPIDFIEFGTYRGRSMKYFSKNFINPNSTFLGLDSFQGLPNTDNHLSYHKGMFNLDNNVPIFDDKRILIVSGFFNDKKKEIKSFLDKSKNKKLIHFDADIYSSTLFALFLCSDYEDYYCIFDQFGDDESRALYNYTQSSGSSVEFYASTYDDNFYLTPKIVFCKISKNNINNL